MFLRTINCLNGPNKPELQDHCNDIFQLRNHALLVLVRIFFKKIINARAGLDSKTTWNKERNLFNF